MPGDTVTPGEPLKIPASDWNALTRMLRDWRQVAGLKRPGSGITDRITPSCLIKVYNDSSIITYPATGVVGLPNHSIDPATNPIASALTPVALAGMPTTTGPVGIALLSIPPETVGYVAVAGVAVASIQVDDIDHEYAVPIDGENTKLQTAESGPIRLLTRFDSTASSAEGLVFVSQARPVPPSGTHDSECDIAGSDWNDDTASPAYIGPLAAGTYLFNSSIIGAILLDATSDDGSQAEILARYDRRNSGGTSQQTYGDFLIVQATYNATLATQWGDDQRTVDSGPMTAIIEAAEGDKVYLQFKQIYTDGGTSPALTAVVSLAEILNGYGVGGVARTCWHRLN